MKKNTVSYLLATKQFQSIQREEAVQCLSQVMDVFSKPYLSLEEAKACRRNILTLYNTISNAIEPRKSDNGTCKPGEFSFKRIESLYWGFECLSTETSIHATTEIIKSIHAANEIIAILACSSDKYLSALECAYLCLPLLLVYYSVDDKLSEIQRYLDKIYIPN